jgi:hypothetical protein
VNRHLGFLPTGSRIDRNADVRQFSPDYGFRGGICIGSYCDAAIEGGLWGDKIITAETSGL